MSDMTNSVLDSKAFEEKVNSFCKDDSGIFMLFVLDERCKASGAVSDSVLAKLISAQVTESDTVGKIESGELAAFFKFQIDPLFPEKFTDKLNESLKACEGADDTFGVFSGAVFAPENGKDFAELYRFARKALDSVVSENKHGTAVYSNYFLPASFKASTIFFTSWALSFVQTMMASGVSTMTRFSTSTAATVRVDE